MTKKLLLFGGAFNPPHKGHMRLLEAAIDHIKPDVTIIMPTSVSPHKVSGDISFHHRYMMSKVFTIFPNVKISGLENIGRKKKNYTIKTLKWLEKKYIGYEIYLLIGSDMLESFTTWSRYRRIISKATLLVASRETDIELLNKSITELEKEGAKIVVLPVEPIVISSSELRKEIKEKKDVKEYLDVKVLEYIKKYNIYG